MLHAGAVAWRGKGLLLPARSGSGKTTLVAALLRAGCRYFSDEVAILDPGTRSLLPFAKSLYIRDGSRAVLAPAYPTLRSATPVVRQPNDEKVWLLPPPPTRLPASSAPVRLVVLPEFRAEAATTLMPVKRSAALRQLIEQSFSLRAHGGRGIGAMVEVLAHADCYALTYGRVDEAVAAVLERLRAAPRATAIQRR